MNIDFEKLRNIVEAALFAAGTPLSIDKIISLFDEDEKPDKKTILEVLEHLKQDYINRGIELVELASGFQFQTSKNLSTWINRLWKERPQKYSNALLEILAIIAHRQPITRGEIEEIRGIQVSSTIIKTLSEHEWIRTLGHRDIPGKPALYGTTKHFLDHFGLKSLDELTSVKHF